MTIEALNEVARRIPRLFNPTIDTQVIELDGEPFTPDTLRAKGSHLPYLFGRPDPRTFASAFDLLPHQAAILERLASADRLIILPSTPRRAETAALQRMIMQRGLKDIGPVIDLRGEPLTREDFSAERARAFLGTDDPAAAERFARMVRSTLFGPDGEPDPIVDPGLPPEPDER